MTVSDSRAPRFPVSIKGVLFLDDRVVLLKNERDEWELPGGKLEPGEDPGACLAREIAEELSVEVAVSAILDCWLYDINGMAEVVIVTYGCEPLGDAVPAVSHEHKEMRSFALDAIDGLPMPEGYRRSIRSWAKLRRSFR